MSSDIKQLPVSVHDNHKRVMFLAKEMLSSEEKLNLVASTNSAPVATRAAESLVRFGYVTFENIQTVTEIQEGRRIKLIITLKKKQKKICLKKVFINLNVMCYNAIFLSYILLSNH